MHKSLGVWSCLALLISSAAVAQTEMPVGWQTLAAEAFTDEADTLFSADPPATADHQKQVVEHAWQTFLNDEALVASGEWATVKSLADLMVGRRQMQVDGDTTGEQVESELATFKSRLSARLAADPDIVTGSSFADLQGLARTTASTGYNLVEQAALHASWMDANDWTALPANEQAELLEGVRGDLVRLGQMSARWTGFVTAPVAGDYTFQLLRQYKHDPHFKLSVGGQLVLDSAEQADSTQVFVSQPVTLAAGQPVSISLELVTFS